MHSRQNIKWNWSSPSYNPKITMEIIASTMGHKNDIKKSKCNVGWCRVIQISDSHMNFWTTDLPPFLVQIYFIHTYIAKAHIIFTYSSETRKVQRRRHDIDSDDCIEWKDIDTHIVKTLIEGYLRIRLSVENVDDVLWRSVYV